MTGSAKAQGRSATGAGLLAVVFWSCSVGLIRSISEALGPNGGAAVLFLASGLLTWLFYGLPRPASLNRVYLWGGGALFVAYEVCLALSLGLARDRAESMQLGMINYLWPSLTIVFAVAARQQRGSPLLWPGVAVCFLGIVWVMKGDAAADPSLLWRNMAANPVAYALAGGASVLWAAYSVLTRRFGEGRSGVPLFLLATAAVLWAKYAASAEPALSFTLSSVLQVLVLAVLTAVAYTCWNHGIQKGNIALLAAASYFTPVLSALLASLWLHVRPSGGFWWGVAMVTAGSLLCWRATRSDRQ